MKVAVFSDIHGNLHALDQVLNVVAREQPDQIVCLGDTVALGPQPGEVTARLRAIGCPIVMGNCDAWFANWPLEEEDSDLYRQVHWATNRLSPQDFGFIKAFQSTIIVPLDNDANLLCFHGSPRSNQEVILATTPDDQIAEILAGWNTTVMIGGHTHLQMVRRHGEGVIVNAGSIGLPRYPAPRGTRYSNPPWAEWAVIEDVAGHLSVELRRTPLDVGTMITMAESSGMPRVDDWMAGWEHGG